MTVPHVYLQRAVCKDCQRTLTLDSFGHLPFHFTSRIFGHGAALKGCTGSDQKPCDQVSDLTDLRDS